MLPLFSTLALCLLGAAAQQYLGDNISNSLPSSKGSEIAYFGITSGNENLTLINYYNLGSDGKRIDPSNVNRLVVMVFGAGRNAWQYQEFVVDALNSNNGAGGPTIDNVAIMTPMFANQDDNVENGNALVWKDDGWAWGENSIYPSGADFSSYSVLDSIIQAYSDTNQYPNLTQIVIAGHSMGAQCVQRWGSLSQTTSNVPITLWPANPDSYVWLDSERPYSHTNCPSYNDWYQGLDNYASSNQSYQSSFVKKGSQGVLNNFQSKQVAWVRSLKDKGNYSGDKTCGQYSQGANRDQRFLAFIKDFPPSCKSPTDGNCDTVDYVDIGHDAGPVISSKPGIARLFTDNWNGDGQRLCDQGARRQEGDNPYPCS